MYELVPEGRLERYCLSVSVGRDFPLTYANIVAQTLADRLHTALYVSSIQRLGRFIYAQRTIQVPLSPDTCISCHLQHTIGNSMEFQGWQGKDESWYELRFDQSAKFYTGWHWWCEESTLDQNSTVLLA